MSFERPRAGWLAASDTVLVTANKLSATRTDLEIVRRCNFDCGPADIDTCTISINERPEQILLTGDGSTLVYTSAAGNAALRYLSVPDIGSCDQSVTPIDVQAGDVDVDLIGTLRSGGWIIYRDADHGLRAIRPGNDAQPVESLDLGDERTRSALVVALGDDHIVVRELRSAHRQVLWSIPVGTSGSSKPVKLATGDFSRVVLTRGEASSDTPKDQHDRHVVATSGKGADALTSVFDVDSGEVLETFQGAVITSAVPLQDVPGLDAVSPDASHLAYVTPAGSLALRDLDHGGGCFVVSHQTGDTGVAGFGRDGTLYYELGEGGDGLGAGSVSQRVFAYDAEARTTIALSDPGESRNLRAVPPTPALDQNGLAVPWAISKRNESLTAVVAHSLDIALHQDVSASFLPRADDDGAMWMVHVTDSSGDGSDESGALLLDRVVPLPNRQGEDGPMEVRPGDSTPLLQSQEPFTFPLRDDFEVCMTAPRPGSWSSRCAPVDRTDEFLRTVALPPSERQPGDGDG